MAEVSIKVLTTIFHFTTFNTSPPHFIHHKELHWQNDDIIISSNCKNTLTWGIPPRPILVFACHHTLYLINRLLTSHLDNSSPFQRLLRKSPNYNYLWIFGCLCYSWLKHTPKIKLNQNLPHVSILDSHYPIIVTSVLTQFLQRCTYPDMCDLLRFFFI